MCNRCFHKTVLYYFIEIESESKLSLLKKKNLMQKWLDDNGILIYLKQVSSCWKVCKNFEEQNLQRNDSEW